jgi:parvulin-like peptidyl-prolyl isomerase
MGLFDGFSKAFSNEGFQAQDQRVRASHILIKGDDIDLVFEKIQAVLGELNERVQQQQQQQEDPETNNLPAIFAELARRDSQCSSSAAKGGDLGLFGPGTMVQEFDMALFPDEGPPPPPGSVIGPVVTEFGCHVILVTQREENRDQVEAKLARIDPDAQ